MIYMILLAAVSVLIVVVVTISNIQADKSLKARIISMFGKPPEDKETEFESIRRYADKFQSEDLHVDDITWNDLEMDSVFERINVCLSSVGEEYLYNTLHQPEFELSGLQEREKLIQFFDEHPDERLAAQFALAKLGKQNYNGLPHLIFSADIKRLPKAWLYKVLAALPLISIAGLFFSIYVGVSGIILSFLVNLIAYHRTIKFVNIELPAIAYFSSMMKCCKRLLAIKQLDAQPIMKKMQAPYKTFKSAASKAPAQQTGLSGDITETIWLYFSILFLYDIRHYNNFMETITNNNQKFHDIYKIIGEVDMALAVLSFRKSLPAFTLPDFQQENILDFAGIFHPLIKEPVTNTHKIENDSLITGSNASGKSTFIKTLAVNGILAQTIYTCTATKFAARLSMVVTSMALRDNLQDKESYFIVEVKSLKRILELVQKYPCTCYIDEILRGTNTVERIAASASVLEYLHTQNCLCIAASHDIELTRILADKYDNYHFCEQVTDYEILFDYKLRQGPSTTRNAIKLLKVIGFDDCIIEKAEALADEFE